jgi:argininosuccinate lyase
VTGTVPAALPGLSGHLAGVVYGPAELAFSPAELMWTTEVDRAHVVMLAESGLVAYPAAARLLTCVADLRAASFEALRGRAAPRGMYLMYESFLIERLGAEVGGVLHTARSRNDLKAAATCLRLAAWFRDFLAEAGRLEAVLLGRARAYRDVVMPVYTHSQAAMPVTYGYYLLGVGLAVGRDLDALEAAARGLDSCPLGAVAVAGTDLPINAGRTARLLGFRRPVRHALDAVASRDAVARLSAGLAQLTVTLSRLAADLQLWSTAEFAMLSFPDRLVGGSSAMPQKRNAFLLEHVRAKAGIAIGALTATLATMKSAPFTNSIEVGTEAVDAAGPAFTAARAAVLLCQAVVGGGRPDPGRMADRAAGGFTTATMLANQLVRDGIPFRTAHELVGMAVGAAVAAGSADAAAHLPPGTRVALPDAAGAVAAARYGGGPGAFDDAHDAAARAWRARRRRAALAQGRQRRASAALDAAVDQVIRAGAAAESARHAHAGRRA